jgi:cytochrome c peroxidase
MLLRNKKLNVLLLLLGGIYIIISCKKDPQVASNTTVVTTPYAIAKPASFPNLVDDPTNPTTVEGINLGRYLFYDSILSQDFTISCASCHKQQFAFSDFSHSFSKGVHGQFGNRNSMALFNKAWDKGPFFWNGRAQTLEIQAGMPVVNPKEMNLDWNTAIGRLQASTFYQGLFAKAFGSNSINKDNATKAIAQFVKSIVSSNSKFDKFLANHDSTIFTAQELKGFILFFTDPYMVGGVRQKWTGLDCFHCHATPLMTPEAILYSQNRGLMGNGLGDSVVKTPSLRNLSYTAPYMFDGSIPTIDSAIGHYNSVTFASPNLDRNMFVRRFTNGALAASMGLDTDERAALKAFLLTLDDPVFITNPAYSNPFKK